MAQLVEHILGKDEVPGSNPGISLRSTPVVRKYDRGISFFRKSSKNLLSVFFAERIIIFQKTFKRVLTKFML